MGCEQVSLVVLLKYVQYTDKEAICSIDHDGTLVKRNSRRWHHSLGNALWHTVSIHTEQELAWRRLFSYHRTLLTTSSVPSTRSSFHMESPVEADPGRTLQIPDKHMRIFLKGVRTNCRTWLLNMSMYSRRNLKPIDSIDRIIPTVFGTPASSALHLSTAILLKRNFQ